MNTYCLVQKVQSLLAKSAENMLLAINGLDMPAFQQTEGAEKLKVQCIHT